MNTQFAVLAIRKPLVARNNRNYLSRWIAPTVEDDIPIPPRGYCLATWSKVLLAMKKEQSFMADTDDERKSILRSAAKIGIKVVTRKIPGQGFRIWHQGPRT
jgi:hypothetical protein